MKRFEYRIVKGEVSRGAWIFNLGGNVDEESLEGEINSLGQQGWELASSLETSMAGGRSRSVLFIFKRELTY
ncbi:MAG TPA: DUF4177 domain-containing protein [Verrucomicrobiales bacterium]|jgi:hypothetical protein|nr:DUF4177 domain-containing protein [Verrucomicrobiales bacterium]